MLKIAVLCALCNLHGRIEPEDWAFAAAFMKWQGELRLAFRPGRSKKVTQGEFNETVMRNVTNWTDKLKAGAKVPKSLGRTAQRTEGGKTRTLYFVNWKRLHNYGKWFDLGMDTEKTVQRLVANGDLAYKTDWVEEQGKDAKEEYDCQWVRLP